MAELKATKSSNGKRYMANGWAKHEEHVLETLNRLEAMMTEFNKELIQIKLSVQELKTKIAIWGSMAIAGLSIAVSVLEWLFKK